MPGEFDQNSYFGIRSERATDHKAQRRCGEFALQATNLHGRWVVFIPGAEQDLECGITLFDLRDKCFVNIWIHTVKRFQDRNGW